MPWAGAQESPPRPWFLESPRSPRRPPGPAARSAGCTESRSPAPAPVPGLPPCPPPRAGEGGSEGLRLGRPLCPHADLLRLLEELALVLDRGRDHELGLLEVAQRLRSADSHRRTQGAHQVLGAVIDPCRT